MATADQPPAQVVRQFDAFYRDRYRPLVAVVYALTGNRWAAEDLAQEAFLKAHRDWDHVRTTDSPEAWIRRVAVNLAILKRMELCARASPRPSASSPLGSAWWFRSRPRGGSEPGTLTGAPGHVARDARAGRGAAA